jgi:hypothetical protein
MNIKLVSSLVVYIGEGSLKRKKENHWTDLCIANKEDDKRLRELYAISGIPYGLLIDKSGKITAVVTAGWRHLGMLLKNYYKDVNGESNLK